MFEAGGVPVGEYSAGVDVRGRDGSTRGRIRFPVTVERTGDVCRIPRIDAFRVWAVVVVPAERELARIDVIIKRTGQAE